MANNMTAFDNNADALRAVARGELAGALVNHGTSTKSCARKGTISRSRTTSSTRAMLARSSMSPAWRSSRRPGTRAADAFNRSLLDVEAQQYFANETAESPIADGIKPYYDDLPPLDQVHGPDIDLNDLDDLKGTLEMLTDLGLL